MCQYELDFHTPCSHWNKFRTVKNRCKYKYGIEVEQVQGPAMSMDKFEYFTRCCEQLSTLDYVNIPGICLDCQKAQSPYPALEAMHTAHLQQTPAQPAMEAIQDPFQQAPAYPAALMQNDYQQEQPARVPSTPKAIPFWPVGPKIKGKRRMLRPPKKPTQPPNRTPTRCPTVAKFKCCIVSIYLTDLLNTD
jgi:hypothetical protein